MTCSNVYIGLVRVLLLWVYEPTKTKKMDIDVINVLRRLNLVMSPLLKCLKVDESQGSAVINQYRNCCACTHILQSIHTIDISLHMEDRISPNNIYILYIYI